MLVVSKETQAQAIETWLAYGQAISEAFSIKGFIEPEPLQNALSEGDEEKVRRFIEHVKQATGQIKRMQYVGEK